MVPLLRGRSTAGEGINIAKNLQAKHIFRSTSKVSLKPRQPPRLGNTFLICVHQSLGLQMATGERRGNLSKSLLHTAKTTSETAKHNTISAADAPILSKYHCNLFSCRLDTPSLHQK